MKFTADRKQFTKEISKFKPFVESKTTIPILSNLLFSVDKNLSITATDLDVSLTSEFKVVDSTKGSISVPARKLSDTLKKMSTLESESLTVEVKDNWIHLTCGDFAVKLVGMDAKQFPSLPKKPDGGVVIPSEVLAELINKTRFAVSKEESRYNLIGALLAIEPESISMVATDGHRLAHITRNSSTFNVPAEQENLIAAAALDRLKPFLNGETVTFSKDENGIQFFQIGNYYLTSRALQGRFPNWKAVLPNDNTKEITLDSKQLAAALSRVSQFASERTQACKFEATEKGLVISASSSETGDAKELVKSTMNGTFPLPLAIGFDARYVQDILKTIDGAVTMKLKDAQSSGLFVPATPSEYKQQVVLMPVRL